MSAQQQDDENVALDAPSFQRMYFDTSAWNHITDAYDRDLLIHLLKRRRQVPLASVLSVAEILQTSEPARMGALCRIVEMLHG